MLASGNSLLELIPQRPPMVMVDSLLACDEHTTVTQLLLKGGNVFMENGKITPSGMMESMAQTAAARTGWLMKNHPGGQNKSVPIGVIGSIKNFRLHFRPQVGMMMTVTVNVQYEIMQATGVYARAEVNGKLAAEAEMQIFLTDIAS